MRPICGFLLSAAGVAFPAWRMLNRPGSKTWKEYGLIRMLVCTRKSVPKNRAEFAPMFLVLVRFVAIHTESDLSILGSGFFPRGGSAYRCYLLNRSASRTWSRDGHGRDARHTK